MTMTKNNTEGIILRAIPHSGSQYIVQLYTREYGKTSAITTRSRKRGSSNYFQPLFHLNCEINYNEKHTIHRITQLRFAQPYKSIPFSIKKHAVAQFLAEILNKVIPENEPEYELFDFLINAFHLYDQTIKNTHNFHLYFLIHLTRFLGFYPGKNNNNQYFSPSEGTFVPQIMHDTVPEELNQTFEEVLNTPFSLYETISIQNKTQTKLLEKILDFYKIHLNVAHIKSYQILKQVFAN